MQEFKFRWFGHDLVILHENDIVKRKPPFSFLQYDDLRKAFMAELNSVMELAPITIISAVILKDKLKRIYAYPKNPYELALLFCLERSREFLQSCLASETRTHIVCEARSDRKKDGKTGKEDAELELEFRRIVAGNHSLQKGSAKDFMPNFDILFASKQSNSIGLQIADLTARPIGLHILRPEQHNRAYEIISSKLWCGSNGNLPGLGLKIFP